MIPVLVEELARCLGPKIQKHIRAPKDIITQKKLNRKSKHCMYQKDPTVKMGQIFSTWLLPDILDCKSSVFKLVVNEMY